jgi:glycosyltransferase involved in cell wall biosynthesis
MLKKTIYLKAVANSLLRHAACLRACSQQEAEHFREVGYRGPIVLIPNGIDIGRFTPGQGHAAETYWPSLKDRRVVVFLGRLSREKGLDILIPAWGELLKSGSYRDAVLVIGGPDAGGYGRTVKALIEAYGVRPNVLTIGMVGDQEKLTLLRRADVFVLPSYTENFGLVVTEALACGTPVIATTGTPWRQLQEIDAGRWVAPERRELGQAVRELLDMSKSQRHAMGERGRGLVERDYAWEKIAPQFVSVCECLREGGSVSSLTEVGFCE